MQFLSGIRQMLGPRKVGRISSMAEDGLAVLLGVVSRVKQDKKLMLVT